MRYFTIEEAQAQIPHLEKIFSIVLDIKSKVQEKILLIESLESRKIPNEAQFAIEKSQLEFLVGSMETALGSIEKMGAVFKGLEPGLVDFPFRLHDEEVYLCWKYGEKKISHYHSITGGYSSRKPLPKNLLQHH